MERKVVIGQQTQKRNAHQPNVAVLLSSYNGEEFIREQIDSILNQKDVKVQLYVRDDGSKDHTVSILQEYSNRNLLKFFQGDNLGVADSFWTLLRMVDNAEFYAWSDQDDVWDSNKLKAAVTKLNDEDSSRPLLYWCGNTPVDRELRNIYQGTIAKKNPSVSLGQALIASYAQGATMVFNRRLRDIAVLYAPAFKEIGILHDAWLHKLCLAVGGKAVFDPAPYLKYRIHGRNVVARKPESIGMLKKMQRMIRSNKTLYNSNVAKELLKGYEKLISDKDRGKICLVANCNESIITRLRLLISKEIAMGDKKKDMEFRIKVLLRRI